VTGDEFSDMFDGEAFTWHVVTTSGAPAKSPSPGGSGGSNGYGY
jgi:hypothetical protein